MEDITIQFDGNQWNVLQADKSSGNLTWEEMLGVVVSLTNLHSTDKCLKWMQTNEQHDDWTKFLNSKTHKDAH